MNDIQYQTFTMDDYAGVYALWQRCDGVGLSQADEPAEIARFLGRNRGMSFVARSGSAVVGAILCGHDGRRGYLHHLAVVPEYRRQGVATELVKRAVSQLRIGGIAKCHLFIFNDNDTGKAFWNSMGWGERGDIGILSKDLIRDPQSTCPC